MKGYVLMPKCLDPFMINRWWHLCQALCTNLGLEFRYADTFSAPEGTEVVISYAIPCHAWPTSLLDLANLPKNIKLVGLMDDMHYNAQQWANPNTKANLKKMSTRYDWMFSSSDTEFVKYNPGYETKRTYLPFCFAPTKDYTSLPLDNPREPKVLITGDTSDFYPTRAFASKTIAKDKLFHLKHPGWGLDPTKEQNNPNVFVGKRYAELINKYQCALTCSSVEGVCVGKYIEIPAAGTLLLAEDCADSRKAGFIPMVHFVPITKSTVVSVVNDVLANPTKYIPIQTAGTRFVRENFSVEHNAAKICEKINELVR